MVKDCVNNDSEDGCEDERSTENEEREWPVIISPRESSSSGEVYLLAKEMGEKVKAWREKEGRDRDAVADAKGDQRPKDGGGKKRGSMLNYFSKRSHSKDLGG